MARGDLFKIIDDIQKELVASRRAEIDAYEHIFAVDSKDIAKQIRIQLIEFRISDRKQNTVALTPLYRKDRDYNQAISALEDTLAKQDVEDSNFANVLADEFVIRMKASLIAAGTTSKVYRITEIAGGTPTRYKLRVEHITGTSEVRKPYGKEISSISVFDFIRNNGITEHRSYVRNKINNYLPKKLAVTKEEKLFDLGHLTAVSSFKISKAKQDLMRVMSTNSELVKTLVGIEVLSQFTQIGDPDLTKVFEGKVSSVEVQSKSFNNLQSTYETAALQALNTGLKKVLDSNRKDWAKQGGSDSLETAIAKHLMSTAKARGAKVSISGKQTKAKTKASQKVSVELRKQTTEIKNTLGQVVPTMQPQASKVNMQNLIPMLNQKLPDLVKSNMGKNGALHNRTGRFAESAEILSISSDGLSVGYTYQTDPYAVFESQGNRDPRRLIDVSIRQAAAGIMNVRFSTGRVR